jgi:hypothetical protein
MYSLIKIEIVVNVETYIETFRFVKKKVFISMQVVAFQCPHVFNEVISKSNPSTSFMAFVLFMKNSNVKKYNYKGLWPRQISSKL